MAWQGYSYIRSTLCVGLGKNTRFGCAACVKTSKKSQTTESGNVRTVKCFILKYLTSDGLTITNYFKNLCWKM